MESPTKANTRVLTGGAPPVAGDIMDAIAKVGCRGHRRAQQSQRRHGRNDRGRIGNHSLSTCRRVLAPNGTFVMLGGQSGRWIRPMDRVFETLLLAPFVSQDLVLGRAAGRDRSAQ